MHEPASSSRSRLYALATLAVVTSFAILIGAAFYERTRLGWRAEYFPSRDFSGAPIVRRDASVAFRWYDDPPMPGIPSQNFSVRWETCLLVDDDRALEVYIGSDDGIRMRIDGEPFIDRFHQRAYMTDHMPVELAPGMHHVVVEYFNGPSEGHALARFQEPGFTPKPLPLEHYRLPGHAADAKARCLR